MLSAARVDRSPRAGLLVVFIFIWELRLNTRPRPLGLLSIGVMGAGNNFLVPTTLQERACCPRQSTQQHLLQLQVPWRGSPAHGSPRLDPAGQTRQWWVHHLAAVDRPPPQHIHRARPRRVHHSGLRGAAHSRRGPAPRSARQSPRSSIGTKATRLVRHLRRPGVCCVYHGSSRSRYDRLLQRPCELDDIPNLPDQNLRGDQVRTPLVPASIMPHCPGLPCID